jgi:alcohol dehydrogenase class IV
MLRDSSLSIAFTGVLEFGVGAITRLPDVLAGLGAKRAFLVTDRGMPATGIIDRVSGLLANVEYEVYSNVSSNPGVDDLDEAAEQIRALGESVVIAVGGGSALDAAKGIALLGANPGTARDFDYRNEPGHPAVPIVAVPTTAGTGAETNGFGVIADGRRKVYIGHSSAKPRVSILDPSLTTGLPPGATAATGMDALTHGIESLASKGSNPVSAAYASQAIALVSRWLAAAVAQGEDLEARSQLLLGAHLAGLALSISGLGLAHGIAHSVTNHTGAVHGLALSAVLAEVMEFCLPAYAAAGTAMGLPAEDDRALAAQAAAACRQLAAEVDADRRLSDLGCDAALVPAIAAGALADGVTANSPEIPAQQQLERLLLETL